METTRRTEPQWRCDLYSQSRNVIADIEVEEADEVYDSDSQQSENEVIECFSASSGDDNESDDSSVTSTCSSYYSTTDLTTIVEETEEDLYCEVSSIGSAEGTDDEDLDDGIYSVSNPHSRHRQAHGVTMDHHQQLLTGFQKWNGDRPAPGHQGVLAPPVRLRSPSFDGVIGSHESLEEDDDIIMSPFLNKAFHKTKSTLSKNSCSTASTSSSDDDDDADSNEQDLLEAPHQDYRDLLQRSASRLSLVSYKTGEVVELPFSDDEYTYISYSSNEDGNSVFSLSGHSRVSVSGHSRVSVSGHSRRGMTKAIIMNLPEENDLQPQQTMPTSSSAPVKLTMETINEDSATIEGTPINFCQSRQALFGRLMKVGNVYHGVLQRPLSPDVTSAEGQSLPPHQQRINSLRRRLTQEHFGGERRRRSYDKSKRLICSQLNRRNHRLAVIEGNSLTDSDGPGFSTPVLPPNAARHDRGGTSTPQSLLDRFGGLQRSNSFKESRELFQLSFEKEMKPVRSSSLRSVSDRRHFRRHDANRERALSPPPVVSPSVLSMDVNDNRTARPIINSNLPLFERLSMSDGNLLSIPLESPKFAIPTQRLLCLKHRIKVERYGGERRRQAFMRSKRIVGFQLDAILREKHIQLSHSEGQQKQQPLVPSSCRSKNDGTVKTIQKVPLPSDSLVSEEEIKDRMGGLQREKSYKESRKIFQDPLGTQLCKKATGGLRDSGLSASAAGIKKSPKSSPSRSTERTHWHLTAYFENSNVTTNNEKSSLSYDCSTMETKSTSSLEQKRLKGKAARDRLRKAFAIFAARKPCCDQEEDCSTTSNMTDVSDELNFEQIVRSLERSPSKRRLLNVETASKKLQDAFNGVTATEVYKVAAL